jgi:translation initiation factor 2 beta subunit (eIF-2beta)/eIF-5
MNRFICKTCGQTYDEHGWLSLVLSERVEPSEARRAIQDWPDRAFVEVRICRSCETPILAPREYRRPGTLP